MTTARSALLLLLFVASTAAVYRLQSGDAHEDDAPDPEVRMPAPSLLSRIGRRLKSLVTKPPSSRHSAASRRLIC